MTHANIRNNQIIDFNSLYLDEDITRVETSEEMYNAWLEDRDKVIYQDGEVIINPDYEAIELEKAKQAKVQENDTARDTALNAGVVYKDVLFDSDTDQKINLLATVSRMSDEDTTIWFGMNNEPLECTKEDLFNIGGLITQLDTFCWTKNAEIKAEIAEASTFEELEAIEINYEIPDEEDLESEAS